MPEIEQPQSTYSEFEIVDDNKFQSEYTPPEGEIMMSGKERLAWAALAIGGLAVSYVANTNGSEMWTAIGSSGTVVGTSGSVFETMRRRKYRNRQ